MKQDHEEEIGTLQNNKKQLDKKVDIFYDYVMSKIFLQILRHLLSNIFCICPDVATLAYVTSKRMYHCNNSIIYSI